MDLKKGLIWGLVFFLFFTGIFGVSVYHNQVYAKMQTLKLIPENPPFTELYFDNSSALPQNIIRHQPFSFSFTIHNLEGATTTYPYSVYLQYVSGAQSVFDSGRVTLSNGAATTISIRHIFNFSAKGPEIVVKLVSLNQQIDFYLTTDN